MLCCLELKIVLLVYFDGKLALWDDRLDLVVIQHAEKIREETMINRFQRGHASA